MPRKLPLLTPETTPFWQGGQHQQLLIYQCSSCQRHFHPPAPVCPHCLSLEVAPVPVKGTAKILSFTINHQAWTPDLTQPFAVAIVELDDTQGVRLVSNIVNMPLEQIRVDMPVRVVFEQHEDVWLPLFEGVVPA